MKQITDKKFTFEQIRFITMLTCLGVLFCMAIYFAGMYTSLKALDNCREHYNECAITYNENCINNPLEPIKFYPIDEFNITMKNGG